MTGTGFTHETTGNVTVEWYTPAWIFAGLGVEFDIDPCSNPERHTPARRHIVLPEDGLHADWGTGLAWVNPPYGPHLPAWMARLHQHGNGIALVFARTDTGWFQNCAADAVLFLRKRVRFLEGASMQPGGTPGAPSCLLAYGDRAVEVLRAAQLDGLLMVLAGARGVTAPLPNLFGQVPA